MWHPNVERVRIVASERVRGAAERVRALCRVCGFEVVDEPDQDVDLVIVVGEDRDVLRVHQGMGAVTVPILGVSSSETVSFLTSSTIDSVERDLRLLREGKFTVSRYERLRGSVDGRREVYAINEIAIFPRRSAVLMDYELNVNGDLMWRDRADGVIVASPTGSTAYALSTGGPVILETAKVFEVVPVNSLDPSRRPLIVPSNSKVRIRIIASQSPCEAIADGQLRVRVSREVEVVRAPRPAYIVRLSRGISTSESMRKKLKQAEELMDMPPSAKYILKILELEGPLTVREISRLTLLPQRTVRYALSILSEKGLVRRRVNLRDARQSIYEVAR